MWALGMPLGYVIELTNSGCQTSTVWDAPLGVIDLIAEYLKRRGSQYSNGKEPARFSGHACNTNSVIMLMDNAEDGDGPVASQSVQRP